MTLRPHADVHEEERRTLYEGRVFDLVRLAIQLPSGLQQNLDLVEHPGAVAILARDDEGRMLIVRQYRAAAGDWTCEIPAGRVESGEDPAATAGRELEEETGYRARSVRSWRPFLPAPGFASEVIHLFHAEGLEAVPGGGLASDDDEEIEVLWMHPRDVLALEPADGKTILAAQHCLLEDADSAASSDA
jgi:ADP-ribose pyrophosphatase